jgi:hypothetical protein
MLVPSVPLAVAAPEAVRAGTWTNTHSYSLLEDGTYKETVTTSRPAAAMLSARIEAAISDPEILAGEDTAMIRVALDAAIKMLSPPEKLALGLKAGDRAAAQALSALNALIVAADMLAGRVGGLEADEAEAALKAVERALEVLAAAASAEGIKDMAVAASIASGIARIAGTLADTIGRGDAAKMLARTGCVKVATDIVEAASRSDDSVARARIAAAAMKVFEVALSVPAAVEPGKMEAFARSLKALLTGCVRGAGGSDKAAEAIDKAFTAPSEELKARVTELSAALMPLLETIAALDTEIRGGYSVDIDYSFGGADGRELTLTATVSVRSDALCGTGDGIKAGIINNEKAVKVVEALNLESADRQIFFGFIFSEAKQPAENRAGSMAFTAVNGARFSAVAKAAKPKTAVLFESLALDIVKAVAARDQDGQLTRQIAALTEPAASAPAGTAAVSEFKLFNDLALLMKQAGIYKDNIGVVIDARGASYDAAALKKLREAISAYGTLPVKYGIIVDSSRLGEEAVMELGKIGSVAVITLEVGKGSDADQIIKAMGEKSVTGASNIAVATFSGDNARFLEEHYSATPGEDAKSKRLNAFVADKSIIQTKEGVVGEPDKVAAGALLTLLVGLASQNETAVVLVGCNLSIKDKSGFRLVRLTALEIGRIVKEFLIALRSTAKSA